MALAAFGFWGVVPVYFKAISHVSPDDVLAHRVVWSVPLIACLLTARRGWPAVIAALRRPRVLATLLLSASLVATNWFFFIYGVATGRILQTSLGYYINPLVNVLLGMLFLRERLTRLQGVAVVLAAAGTASLALRSESFPWIALVLAFSFGFYGLLRKTVSVDSVGGLFVETLLLLPAAAGYLALLAFRGSGAFRLSDPPTAALLAASGAVTALPLIGFAGAARRLPYSTLGLMQYIAPSVSFLLAVSVYGERFTAAHAVAFGLIWLALTCFSVDRVGRRGG